MHNSENQDWSAGVGVGEPGYLKAACSLLWRFFHHQPDLPPNVALAAGYVVAQASGLGSGPPPNARRWWVAEWQHNGKASAVLCKTPGQAQGVHKDVTDADSFRYYQVEEIKDQA